MGFFRDYTYDTTKVTAICADTNGGNYVWVAFSASGGNCILIKASATDLNQVYFTVSVPVTSINEMVVNNGYIFLAVTHATIFSIAYSLIAPLTSFISMNKPSGIVESPIDVITDNLGDIYFLTPGILSSQEAKIVITTNLNVYEETVNLIYSSVFITYASSITMDASNNFWVTTSSSPAQLIRVWNPSVSAPSWNIQKTVLS